MTERRGDPARQLVHALASSAAAAGCAASVEHGEETPWASITFTGARHLLTVTAADPSALAHWLATLPETELPLPGRFVASCAAEQAGRLATIELLVLEE